MSRVVLFDLGGVIVDLTGLERFMRRHRLDPATFWAAWLELGAGHEFESGRTTPNEFADAFLAQFEIDLTPDGFLAEFAQWPTGLLPGAAQLLGDLRAAGVLTATLSNTNPIHWHSTFNQDVVMPLFDRHFPSFELGRAKPDWRLFEDVICRLGVDPANVTFLDDKLVNVEAARRVGMQAFQVDGPGAARRALARPPDRDP